MLQVMVNQTAPDGAASTIGIFQVDEMDASAPAIVMTPLDGRSLAAISKALRDMADDAAAAAQEFGT